MKKILLVLLILNSVYTNSQTVIRYDYMETWNWEGIWFAIPSTPVGWSTFVSVTPSESAVIFGQGNSTVEDGVYSMPNVSGLDPNKLYQFRFRLASYSASNPTALSRGVDGADIININVSSNGGSYINELRIRGNNNALWDYNATGVIAHTSNGSFTNLPAPSGDVYQSPAGTASYSFLTNGLSYISLDLLPNINQVAVDIFCRVNSAGEEWRIDNIELVEINPLPVELISFVGINTEKGNLIVWKTASEHNSDYYLIQSSNSGEFNEESTIAQKSAAGNSTQLLEYTFLDNTHNSNITYYRLLQYDLDGGYKIYGPISIYNPLSGKKIIKIVNSLGQVVDENTKGFLFEVYEDGTTKKIIR